MIHLLSVLALPRGQSVAYREEVTHPALERPEVAEGTMSITPDGSLVRDQTAPERQISEIGERFLTTRSGPDAEPSLYPIPEAAQPVLAAIRGVLAGDTEAIEIGFATDLSSDGGGWRLVLRPADGSAKPEIRFAGCGPVLDWTEVATDDGVRRTVRFLAAR